MKVLVTGVNGQLGYDVCRVLSARNIEHKGVDIADFDITDRKAAREYITEYHPGEVIHCSAWTAVDRAEDELEKVRAVNTEGPRNIAAVCKEINAKMLYISTATKLEGEQAVQELLEKYFIVRISWVFGKNGNNFVKTMLRLAETTAALNVVCDQIGSPTYTADLAPLLCDMIVTEKYGVYHATNEGVCTWAEFAQEIFRLAGKTVKVNPVPTSEYPTRAARPLNSRMSKDKLEKMGFSRLPDWHDALARYIHELEGADRV